MYLAGRTSVTFSTQWLYTLTSPSAPFANVTVEGQKGIGKVQNNSIFKYCPLHYFKQLDSAY